MKLKKLTIKGLASIQDATIDFSEPPLADSPLFLLCGETGAGKTTVLDAICLALFGKTPRYQDKVNKNVMVGGFAYTDPLQLVRHGAKESWVTLTFNGNDGKEYEAKWTVEFYVRGEKKGTPNRILWEWRDLSPTGILHTDKNKHLTNELLPRAIGLDFEQFCRTTLLAQGQFTQFLLAEDDEKSSILEKLTNTERFSSLGKLIAKTFNEKKEDVAEMEGRLKGMAGLSVNERAELEDALKSAEAKCRELQNNVDDLTRKAQWRKRWRELVESGEQAQRSLEEANATLNTDEFRADARIVEKWDMSQPIHEFVRERLNARCEIEATGKRLVEARSEFARCRGGRAWLVADVEAKASEVKRNADYLDSVAGKEKMFEDSGVILQNLVDAAKSRENELRLRKEMSAMGEKLPALANAVSAAEKVKHDAEVAVNQKEVEIQNAEALRDAIDINVVNGRQNELTMRKEKAIEGKTLAENVKVRTADIAHKEESLSIRRKELGELTESLTTLESESKNADGNFAKTQDEVDRLNSLIGVGIKQLCAQLNVGDTCPVCGHRIEKLAVKGSFDALVKELDVKRKAALEARTKANDSLNSAKAKIYAETLTIAGNGTDLEKLRNAVAVEEAQIKKLASELDLASCTVDAFATCANKCAEELERLANQRNKYDEMAAVVDRLRKEYAKLTQVLAGKVQVLTKAQKDKSDGDVKLDKLKNAAEEERRRFDEKKNAAASKITIANWEEQWNAAPRAFENVLKTEVEVYANAKERSAKLKAEYEQAKGLLQDVDNLVGSIAREEPEWITDDAGIVVYDEHLLGALFSLDAGVKSARDTMDAKSKQVGRCDEKIRAFIANNPEFNEDRLVVIAKTDVTPMRKRIDVALNAVTIRKGALESAKNNLESHLATCPEGLSDDLADNELETQLENARGEHRNALTEKGQLEERKRADNENAKKRSEAEALYKKAQETLGEWKPLNDAFGDSEGRKIRRVIQSYVLKNVLVNANHYLKQLCPDRFELSCVGLTLTVTDAFDGVERPVKTLSGGEKFLVSLALALGLAGMNDKGLAVDMLFIDEGFGTLSNEHLEKAIDELEKLNSVCGSRKVGIISHVERLKERINTRIEIRRLGGSPSEVKVVRGPWTEG